MPKFKSGESRNQIALFPPTIDEYISEDHLSRLVLSIVSSLNLKNFTDKFSGRGQRPYSPATLISILFYGYSIGIRSSRKLSKACEERLDFMYLTGKLQPSYKTISEFRRENLSKVSGLFEEIILIGMKLDIVRIGNLNIAIDGSKVSAYV